MLEVCVGIYRLKCVATNKSYVGSAQNCRTRTQTHRNKLLQGKHINQYLQDAWNKYGPDQFVFELLEKCSKADLKQREQSWINHLNSGSNKFGFNLAPAVRQVQPSEYLSKTISWYWANLSDEERNERIAHTQTEKGRELLRQNAIKLWADPAYRKLMSVKVSATMKKHCKKPEVVAQRTKSSRDYWASADAKNKMSYRMLNQWEKMPVDVKAKRLAKFVKPRETTKFLTFKGATKPLKEWATESGLPYGLLLTRLNKGTISENMFLATYKRQALKKFARKWLREKIK